MKLHSITLDCHFNIYDKLKTYSSVRFVKKSDYKFKFFIRDMRTMVVVIKSSTEEM